tara:strand:+ start:981 stop:1739 length:759 start_codon:yes stop_codon:yes gene_type:complete
MAFLGSVGKLFGITGAEAANIASSFATGGLGQAALTTLSSLGDAPVPRTQQPDVTQTRPQGVDSPQTVSRVSQTSRFVDRMQDQGLILGGPRPAPVPQQAFIGPLAGPIIGAGRQLLSKPGASSALVGAGAGFAADFVMDMFGNQKKLVITRKLQRDVKKVFMLSGGDLSFIADNSMMLFGKDLSEDQLLKILFKTFKNQGPFVTKAAVRKTRSTIRKMETLCDLKDRLCPPKPARRRPAARKMSTSITQVK